MANIYGEPVQWVAATTGERTNTKTQNTSGDCHSPMSVEALRRTTELSPGEPEVERQDGVD